MWLLGITLVYTLVAHVRIKGSVAELGGDQQGPWSPLCHGMLGKKLWLSEILIGFFSEN
jgi:hypothetical protein